MDILIRGREPTSETPRSFKKIKRVHDATTVSGDLRSSSNQERHICAASLAGAAVGRSIGEAIQSVLKSCRHSRDVEAFDPSKALYVEAAGSYLPKDNPKKPRGEDAHFVCAERNSFGVADGVGGWVKKGVDAGRYARELMAHAAFALQSDQPKAISENPKEVLLRAFSKSHSPGSSTACLITLVTPGNILRAANVGDSGFLVLRGGKVVYKSPIQQRSFGCPFQLGKTKDNPSVAEEIEVAVESGDVVVAGTDGLFDNLWEREIEEEVKKGVREGMGAKKMASNIASLALYNSFDRFRETPYSRAAKATGRSHRGGKIDDITVVVAHLRYIKKS